MNHLVDVNFSLLSPVQFYYLFCSVYLQLNVDFFKQLIEHEGTFETDAEHEASFTWAVCGRINFRRGIRVVLINSNIGI